MPPTEQDTQFARQIALSAERELAMLKQNLSVGTGHIHPKIDIAEFKRCLDDHKGVYSSLRRFPTETLQEIMVLAANFPDKYYIMDENTRRLAWALPRRLSQVNRAWRRAAIGLPMLWSYLFVPHIKRVPVKQLDIYLSRSGSALLTVSLTMRTMGFGSNVDLESKRPSQQEKRLDLLLSTCQRWKELFLVLDGGMPFLESIRGQLTNLRYLSVQANNCSLLGSPFRNAPSLTYISFSPTTKSFKNLENGFSFSALQELKLVNCTSDVTSALLQCVQLRVLSLHRTVFIARAVTLPLLRALHIRDLANYSRGMEHGLPRLIMPSLQILTVDISVLVRLRKCLITASIPSFTSAVQNLVIHTDGLDLAGDLSKFIHGILEHFAAVETLTMIGTYKRCNPQKPRYFLDTSEYSSLRMLKGVVVEFLFSPSEFNERRTVDDAPDFLSSLGLGRYVGELMYSPPTRMIARHWLEKVEFRSNRRFQFTEQCRKEIQLLLKDAFVLDLDGEVMDEWEVKRRQAV
jgi:hypothetical protein